MTNFILIRRPWSPFSVITRFISENGSDAAKLKAAFSLLLTLRAIPLIYAGDEIAMPGGGDPDNRRVLKNSLS